MSTCTCRHPFFFPNRSLFHVWDWDVGVERCWSFDTSFNANDEKREEEIIGEEPPILGSVNIPAGMSVDSKSGMESI